MQENVELEDDVCEEPSPEPIHGLYPAFTNAIGQRGKKIRHTGYIVLRYCGACLCSDNGARYLQGWEPSPALRIFARHFFHDSHSPPLSCIRSSSAQCESTLPVRKRRTLLFRHGRCALRARCSAHISSVTCVLASLRSDPSQSDTPPFAPRFAAIRTSGPVFRSSSGHCRSRCRDTGERILDWNALAPEVRSPHSLATENLPQGTVHRDRIIDSAGAPLSRLSL